MKRIALILAGIVGLLLAAAAIVPFFIPKEVYKAQIESAAENALGREVGLNGDVGVSILPSIAARVEDVLVSNPDGFTDEHMISAGALRASVKLAPLFSGRVEVAEISFEDATVSLERLTDGRANWEFGDGDEPAETGDGGPSAVNAGIDRARLTNANVTYRDHTAGTEYRLENLNAEASVQSFDSPLSFEGDGLFNGDAFDVSLRLDSPNALLAGETVDITLDFASDLADIAYDGAFTLQETPSAEGAFSLDVPNLAALAAYAGVDMDVDLGPLGGVQAAGDVVGPADRLSISFDRLRQAGDLMTASFDGDVIVAASPLATGNIELKVEDTAALVAALNLEDALPVDPAPIGQIDFSGALATPEGSLTLSVNSLTQRSPLMSTNFSGDLSLADAGRLDGRFTANAADAAALIDALGIDASSAGPLKRLDVSGAVSGPFNALTISNLDARHESPVLSASYSGSIGLGGAGRMDGRLEASSGDLRGLLDAAGSPLPPGETMKTFSVSGDASGTFSAVNVSDVSLALDDIAANGAAGVRLDGPRPTLTADMTFNALDLTPFMGPSEETSGWSDEPLDLAALDLVNLDLKARTPSLVISTMRMTDVSATAALTNGDFDAALDSFRSFGGAWSGAMGVDIRGATPSVTLKFNGDGAQMQEALQAFTGLGVLSGTGAISLDVASRGASVKQIMTNLDGAASARLNDGSINGLNAAQLVRSVQQALTSGAIPTALSPSSATDFTSLNAALDISNGVGRIRDLSVDGPAVKAKGSGTINLGAQTLDVRIETEAVGSTESLGLGLDLGGLGIPLRLTGPWTSPSPAFDTDWVSQRLQAQALDRLTGGLRPSRSGAQQDDDTAQEPSVENVLGGLLGEALGADDTDEDEDEEPEDRARDVLKGIFGGGD